MALTSPKRLLLYRYPARGKATILSVEDDSDGIGFVVTIQPLGNADTFEIEKR